LAATHAKVANSGSGKMVIARYCMRYFFQKRAALPLSLLENYLAAVARYCPALFITEHDGLFTKNRN